MSLYQYFAGKYHQLMRLDQAVATSKYRSLGAVADIKFIENINCMTFNRMRADKEEIPDFIVGIPLGNQHQHLNLSVGQKDLRY